MVVGRFRLDMDLEFSFTDEEGAQAQGTAVAAGTEVVISLDGLGAFNGGGMPSLEEVRTFAGVLALQGLSICIEGPDGRIISLGDVKAPASQRLITRSPHIRLGKLGAMAPLVKLGRKQSGGFSLLPPTTPFPVMPTVQRKIVRRTTTTHHTRGSGRPRLIFVQDSATWNGQVPREVTLDRESIRIGSGNDMDVQLAGLEQFHAEIVHNEADEYVLVPHGTVSGSVSGPDDSVLRTGARLQMGQWCLAYFREEFADHGRPFGGRSGGELAFQRTQHDPRTGTTERDGSQGVY